MGILDEDETEESISEPPFPKGEDKLLHQKMFFQSETGTPSLDVREVSFTSFLPREESKSD